MAIIVLGKQDVQRPCGVCHRTLLLGERAVRFSPGRDEWLDVCPLCVETAHDHGWIREGSGLTPFLADSPRRRRRRRFLGSSLLEGTGLFDGGRLEPEPQSTEPMLRRLSRSEQEIVEAVELFNASSYRRTVAGIARSLGDAQVSLVPLSGANAEVVVTVAWDISWYQYRVSPDSPQHVRLAERGYELDDLDPRFMHWNGHLDGDGRVTPDIPRL
jgi:hypothetical protein